jgi:hypothetical protein
MQALRDKLERRSFDLTAKASADAWTRLVDNRELSVLAGDPLAGRFRHWRGLSGRRYIFSVYDQASCPAYDDVVLIVAVVEADEARRIVFIADTGVLPELTIASARKVAGDVAGDVEFHVHLLAGSRWERAAAIEDLRPA